MYASESLALSLAECLVHLPGRLPADYHAFRLDIPADATERLDLALLRADWTADTGYTRAVGDQWIMQTRSLALVVPSAVLADSFNILLNPAHPDIEAVVVTSQPFRFDPRLRKGDTP